MQHTLQGQLASAAVAAGSQPARSLCRVLVGVLAVLAMSGGVWADVIDAEHSGHRRLVAEIGWLPADVELVIATDGGAGLVRPPLGPMLLDLAGQGVPMTGTMLAWDEFARLLRMEPGAAFDAVLATRFVFAARRVAGEPRQGSRSGRGALEQPAGAEPAIDGDRVEWVIVTLVDDATARRLTQSLRAAPRGVRDGRPQLVLEGGSFTLDIKPDAQRGKSWVSIGPTAAAGLLDLARSEGPGARLLAPGGLDRAPGRIGTDRGFDPIRAMARSFRSPMDEPGALPEMAIAAEAAGELPRSRLFVFARLDSGGDLQLSRAGGRSEQKTPTNPSAQNWIALFGEALSDTIRIDSLMRLESIVAAESEFHAWPSATFDALADGALAAGMIAGPALRARQQAGQLSGGRIAGLADAGIAGLGVHGGIAEQLGLPVTRLAWTINDRGGVFDAAIALETAAVDGLVAQGDAFMRAMLTPILGEEPTIHQGTAIGQTVADHSMRVVRTPRPLAWLPKGEAAAPGQGPGGSVAWTYRVCPIAARADEECPSAWWTVGLSPELVAAITDRLTEEHLGLPQRWLTLQTLRPRALHARLILTGLPVPHGLDQLRRVEHLRWREALLPSGLVLGQGVIEAVSEEVAER